MTQLGTSDIEIARAARLQPIARIAEAVGLDPDEIEPYGRFKAKIPLSVAATFADRPDGSLILVTAMTPTPAGEGKSTMTVGLGDALHRLGKKTMVALREPSLGPCFGVKGGAAGGGHSQVAPMEDINLHFTGDLHAITSAHNLLAALLDNHLFQGNALGIDSRRVHWKRVVDLNDRALRHTIVGLGGPINGVPRESGFDITVASEIMAILCLSKDLADLKERVGRIILGETRTGEFVTAGQLGVAGALTVLLKDAINPNLVQTLEGTPAIVHGGPFANIAHGCNSLVATRLALKLADIVVTEAGFASDLGAEKFFDIKCRIGGLKPAAAVIVATIRALKMHGGVAKKDLNHPDVDAVTRGLTNLEKHIENVSHFGIPAVVAVNRFTADTEPEIQAVVDACKAMGARVNVSNAWALGGAGAEDVARDVLEVLQPASASTFKHLYSADAPLAEKLETIARKMYGADGIVLAPTCANKLAKYEAMGYGNLPVCIAKTQNSLSDDPKRLGRPTGFKVTFRDAKLSAGAGFVVAYAGDIMTMPGLPPEPSALKIDIDESGNVVGLF